MHLTKDYLLSLRQNAVAQQQHHANMVQQAKGTIDLIDHLVDQLDLPEQESNNAPNPDCNNQLPSG
jgi:hypothetical protein